ncbi:hypothetical protein CVT25_011099 [Psilocybe cyanescens]|uniref:RING-type domain-containing protein n=1 Tax=Psilocybe cyanescens TaxID=93625 RepID=A0A409WGK4_PSICY|nr:hypothetical protein CVT25_011099 [Psilocybe cyanescens]
MPTTRSVTQKTPRAPSLSSEVQTRDEDSSERESTSLLAAIEGHLNKAQSELRKFKRQIGVLQKEKKDLKSELEDAQNLSASQIPGRKSDRRKSDDDMVWKQVDNSNLRKRVKELTLLMSKELQEEVEDLLPKKYKKSEDENEVDPEYRMRKVLLRKFSDLMLVTTIQDDMTQTCSICFENLQLNNCSALQCQHLICHDCLPMISKGEDETVKCPECREPSERDSLEKITMTEQDRWDRLLEVAQAWDAWDHRGEEETSEEEAEESFIDDGMRASEASSEVANEIKSAQVQSPCGDGNGNPPTPPPCNSRLFSESPMKEKRKRMELLAEERAHKRKR